MKLQRPLLWMLVACCLSAAAQTAPAPAFEVATIKPGTGFTYPRQMGPERFNVTGNALRDFIGLAYDLKNDQIAGGPDWIVTERYDVTAKAERESTPDEIKAMLRTLLADRFELKFHREPKVVSGYALVVDPKGVQLSPSKEGSPPGPIMIRQTSVDGKGVSMAYLADFLTLDRKQLVIDQTGLSGLYDFRLSYDDGELTPPDGDLSGTRGSVFSALQALGLKLLPRKLTVDTLVIDHAARPSEN